MSDHPHDRAPATSQRTVNERGAHTETPWCVEVGTTLVWGACTVFDDGSPDRLGIPVGDAQLARAWSSDGRPSYEEAVANASLVVRAVNAHADMLAALRLMTETYWGVDDDKNGDGGEPPSMIVAARAAIRKAEGR